MRDLNEINWRVQGENDEYNCNSDDKPNNNLKHWFNKLISIVSGIPDRKLGVGFFNQYYYDKNGSHHTSLQNAILVTKQELIDFYINKEIGWIW